MARLALFAKDEDAFERFLAEAMDKHPKRLLSYQVDLRRVGKYQGLNEGLRSRGNEVMMM